LYICSMLCKLCTHDNQRFHHNRRNNKRDKEDKMRLAVAHSSEIKRRKISRYHETNKAHNEILPVYRTQATHSLFGHLDISLTQQARRVAWRNAFPMKAHSQQKQEKKEKNPQEHRNYETARSTPPQMRLRSADAEDMKKAHKGESSLYASKR